ncbi:MAG: hypothetical protein Kow0080_30530 [Candidatus Promineifilaceae bacterium]
MANKPPLNNYSVEELQQALYLKKQAQRRQRLARLKAEGRVVEIAGLSPPTEIPPLPKPSAAPSKTMPVFAIEASTDEPPQEERDNDTGVSPLFFQARWQWVRDRLLLLVEVTAVIGLAVVLLTLWQTERQLNKELSQAQQAEVAGLALPTPTATPIIDVVVLPSGHKPPVDGRPPEPGEAGNIPAHLLPAINAYKAPPAPTPGPQQARRIQIPAINIDKPVVQGDDWEQLKKGVGQHIGTALPGETGNMVLSAHNDIYGEIFRDLDKLQIGDEIQISTDLQTFTYIVTDIQIVDPTDVWVMQPTDFGRATLISCYPYRINTHRIVVFADLVDEGNGS